MQNHSERLLQLLQQYLSGSLNDQEKIELKKMIDADISDKNMQEIISEQLHLYDAGEQSSFETISKDRAKELFGRILENRDAPLLRVIERKKARTIWLKWAAAAAVIILIAGAGFKYFSGPAIETPSVAATDQPYPYDVPAGKMNAVLTLSNGTSIDLDSAANGNIARQGATNIKKEAGRISYDYAGGLTDVEFNTISTARGNQYMVILPDGTNVWLNASSSITFPTAFTGTERRVKISGEAYFEVAKLKNMPFRVNFAGDGEIEVLGTHFNINAYRDDAVIKTTLIEGSVRISKNKENGLLVPGQQAQLRENTSMRITDADIDEVMAWKNGFFSFKDADIKTIMLPLSRWYDVDIQFEGQTGKQLFTGEIDRTLNLISVLKILEKTKVHFRLEENRKLVILP